MIEIYLRKTDNMTPSEQSAAVWELLRELLSRKGFAEEQEIVKNDWKKPYFKGNPIYFNLSHTTGAVAVALSDREVGVDLQIVRPISPGVAKRWLASDSTDPRELTRKWVELESYGKYLGCGIPVIEPDRPHVLTVFEVGELMLGVCGETESAPEPKWV